LKEERNLEKEGAILKNQPSWTKKQIYVKTCGQLYNKRGKKRETITGGGERNPGPSLRWTRCPDQKVYTVNVQKKGQSFEKRKHPKHVKRALEKKTTGGGCQEIETCPVANTKQVKRNKGYPQKPSSYRPEETPDSSSLGETETETSGGEEWCSDKGKNRRICEEGGGRAKLVGGRGQGNQKRNGFREKNLGQKGLPEDRPK